MDEQRKGPAEIIAELRIRLDDAEAQPPTWLHGATEPVPPWLPVTTAALRALLAELDRTTGDLAVAAEVARERGQEVERLRKVAEAVEALHRPIRVYDECDHDDCQAEQIEVCDYMACADSVIGWGCESCCYDEDYPIEDCPHGADHRGVSKDDSCPTHAAVRAWREGPC